MTTLTAIAFLGGLSVLLAVILVIANAKLKVYEDPRIEVVSDMLPGANCGACGFPGCRAFAERVVTGDQQPSGCP
ncbi:MAG: Fe-S cluster protein, partial [Calditrichaeota bacterium]|nr:Fe-S cluster protein [Calditrichota bacterium]